MTSWFHSTGFSFLHFLFKERGHSAAEASAVHLHLKPAAALKIILVAYYRAIGKLQQETQ